MRPVTSPAAKTCGALVLRASSTAHVAALGLAPRPRRGSAPPRCLATRPRARPPPRRTNATRPRASRRAGDPSPVFSMRSTPPMPVRIPMPLPPERLGHPARDLLVLAAEDARRDVEQQHPRTERREDRGELATRGRGADHGDRGGQALHRPDVAVGQGVLAAGESPSSARGRRRRGRTSRPAASLRRPARACARPRTGPRRRGRRRSRRPLPAWPRVAFSPGPRRRCAGCGSGAGRSPRAALRLSRP